MDKMTVKNINVYLSRHHVLKNFNLSIAPNKITAIIGPNGSGKSTFLKTLSGLIKPKEGEITLDNRPIHFYSRKQLSQKVSFLMQNPIAPENITVKELVSLGRFSHQTWTGLNAKDHAQIHWSIQQVNLENKMDTPISNLSGGQQKRAWIAMALAQDSEVLLLDEPMESLDIRHQLEILFILKKLKHHFSKTIVIVLHDIQQAIKFADELIIMDEGQLISHQKNNPHMDIKILEQVFGIKIKLFNHDNEMILVINKLTPETLNE